MSLRLSAADIAVLESIREHLNSNPACNQTIQQLAYYYRMNDHKLKHGFKLLFKVTINFYREGKKMERALLLLTDPDLTIAAVAHKCGYSTASTFFRAFRRRHKMSPREWRQKYFDEQRKKFSSDGDNNKDSPETPPNPPDLQ